MIPCYPLVADSLDDDIYTLFASGPPRVLRNVARAILAAAEDWPAVRSVYLQEANQTFDHLGEAHLLMPAQAARYLADRLFALVVDVPETVLLVRCAASDLPEPGPQRSSSRSLVYHWRRRAAVLHPPLPPGLLGAARGARFAQRRRLLAVPA